MGHTGVEREVEAVWRIGSARLVAALAGMVGDVGLAEESAQDALVCAPSCAGRPCACAGSSPGCCPRNPRCTGCSR